MSAAPPPFCILHVCTVKSGIDDASAERSHCVRRSDANVDDATCIPFRGRISSSGQGLMVSGHRVVSWLLSPRYVCRISYLA